jgi:hypothetical protein
MDLALLVGLRALDDGGFNARAFSGRDQTPRRRGQPPPTDPTRACRGGLTWTETRRKWATPRKSAVRPSRENVYASFGMQIKADNGPPCGPLFVYAVETTSSGPPV